MQLHDQIAFKNDINNYNYLKQNSWYYKDLNRGVKSIKDFDKDMKIKYKQRATDKINNALDSIDIISSMLDIIK